MPLTEREKRFQQTVEDLQIALEASASSTARLEWEVEAMRRNHIAEVAALQEETSR